jgi:uncharacterized membrane protein YdbT with pleckstrin-like domain
MPLLPSFLTNPLLRRWALQVIGVLLVFGLLVLGIWLYYSYKIRELEQRTTNPSPMQYTP